MIINSHFKFRPNKFKYAFLFIGNKDYHTKFINKYKINNKFSIKYVIKKIYITQDMNQSLKKKNIL